MSEKAKKNNASQRLAMLFDDGIFTEIDAAAAADCGAKAAYGSVGGATVFAFCQDAGEKGGYVDRAHAKKLAKVYDLAAKTGAPVVTVYDANGVKVDDGFGSLEAASAMLHKCAQLSGVVPQIAVVAGTCAGFAAMAAAQADVCVMAKDAKLFMTSPFADKANGGTAKEVGSAAFAEKAGVAAIVCDDEQAAIEKAADLVKLFPLNNLAPLPVFDFEDPAFAADACGIADADSATELYAALGCGAKTWLATLGGAPCGIVELCGKLDKDDTAKCAKLIQLCDAFNLPVISIVDSEGFAADAEGDAAGGIKAAAKLAHVMSEATTVKLSVIKGSAIGSVFTTFCGANGGSDLTFAWPGAVVSPVNPKAAVVLFWEDKIEKDSDIESLAKAYAAEEASAEKAAAAGLVESVIAPEATRMALIAAMDMLAPKRVSNLPKKHGNLPL